VKTGERAAGSHDFVWDGKDADGNQLPDGVYTIQVNGVDSDDHKVEFTTRAIGKVIFQHPSVDVGDPEGGPLYDAVTAKLAGVYYVEDVFISLMEQAQDNFK